MALSTPTLVQSEESTSNNVTFAFTTSLTPVAGRTYLFILRATRSGSFSGATPTVTHSGGLVLTAVRTQLGQEAGNANGCQHSMFIGRATGTETAGTFTVDTGTSATQTSHMYQLIAWDGGHATTPIPQSASGIENDTTDGTLTVSLGGAFAGAGSFSLSSLSISNGNTAPTVPTGWTQLGSTTNTAPTGRLVSAYYAGNDASADWTGANTGGTEDLNALVVELQEDPTFAGDDSGFAPLPVYREERITSVFI